MIHQKHVDYYIEQFKSGKIKFNKERADLIEYLERDVLSRDDVYFDDVMIDKCIAYGEKWFFPMQPFQKFLIAFIFFFSKRMTGMFIVSFFGCLAVVVVKTGCYQLF